jgi:hypothetical protein
MAKSRSPNYPSVDLATALEAVRAVFKAENRNKFSRLVLAQNLGYSSLNGRALGKIGAVRAYGLVEGSGDDLRLSEDAIVALMAPETSHERREALERCALKPALFQELSQEFQSLPSENNLKFWLIKRHFTPEAAGKAAETYLSTFQLVGGSGEEYNRISSPEGNAMQAVTETGNRLSPYIIPSVKSNLQRSDVLQETFNLKEGPVTLSFPATLSADSYEDLADQLGLILKRMKRRVAAEGTGNEDN